MTELSILIYFQTICIFLRIVHFFTCFCCCWIVDTCVWVYISWQKFFIQHAFLTGIKIVKIFPQLIFCFLILLMVVLSCRNTDFFCMDQKNWEIPWKTESGWYQIRRNKIRENHSEKPEKSCFGDGNGSSTDQSSESMDLRNGGSLGQPWGYLIWSNRAGGILSQLLLCWAGVTSGVVPRIKQCLGTGAAGADWCLGSKWHPGQTWRPHSKRSACRGPPILWARGEVGAHSHPQNLHLKDQHGGFPGGSVVKNPPANAGDMGSSPGPGGSHMPWSNYAREP